MAGITLGLGKGLDALIRETGGPRETGVARDSGGVQQLAIGDIVPNPDQPRRKFAEKALEELAASIASQGLLQPILVRPSAGTPSGAIGGKYEIIAGERRWRASAIAGLSHIPAIVRSFNDQETLAAALIENLQREDLNPIEEAQGIRKLKEEFGLSQEDLARRLGKSRSAVANSLRLLSLPEHCHKDIVEGKLSAGHARALLSITQERAREYLRNLILEENLSVREAEGLAAAWKDTGSFMPGLFTDGTNRADRADEQNAPGASPDTEHDAHDPQASDESRRHLDAGAQGFLPDNHGPEEQSDLTVDGNNAPRRQRPQSALLFEIQSRLHSALSVPVRVTGKESRGKISFSYGSKEELEMLLERLAGISEAQPADSLAPSVAQGE